jgi:hypothetical protein
MRGRHVPVSLHIYDTVKPVCSRIRMSRMHCSSCGILTSHFAFFVPTGTSPYTYRLCFHIEAPLRYPTMPQNFCKLSLTKKIDMILQFFTGILALIGGFLTAFGDVLDIPADDLKIAVAVLTLVAGIINLFTATFLTENGRRFRRRWEQAGYGFRRLSLVVDLYSEVRVEYQINGLNNVFLIFRNGPIYAVATKPTHHVATGFVVRSH